MNKLLIIISTIIGLPMLIFLAITFLTGGSIDISIENEDTGVKKEFKFNADKE